MLKALLPDSDTDIKGQNKSYDDLFAASGYARRPRDFGDLISLLDSELRLITPTEEESEAGDAHPVAVSHSTTDDGIGHILPINVDIARGAGGLPPNIHRSGPPLCRHWNRAKMTTRMSLAGSPPPPPG